MAVLSLSLSVAYTATADRVSADRVATGCDRVDRISQEYVEVSG
jgi:hypothetical protein